MKTWSHGSIYCTIPTCNLVKKQFGIADKYLNACEFNKTYEYKGVKFTFLDANHCPGSSLVLFQVSKTGKAFLHTGDMRFDRSKMLDCEELRPYMRDDIRQIIEERDGISLKGVPKKQLESIFIDTTYCDPFYTFPKQVEAIDFIADLLESKFKNTSKSYLVLIGTYLIGKERIAEGLSKRTGKKVFVTFEKYKTLECLELPYFNIFTMNIAETNIHIVNMKDVSWKRLFQIKSSNRNVSEIIAIKPSAWCFKDMDIPKSMPLDGSIPEVPVKAVRNGNITLIEVPYSEHSSFTELKDCVETFNYDHLVPTVYNDPHHKARIIEMLSDDFQYTPIRVKFTVPEIVMTDGASGTNSVSTPRKKSKKEEKPKRDKNQKSISLFLKKSDPKPIQQRISPNKNDDDIDINLDDYDFDDENSIDVTPVSESKSQYSESPMSLYGTPQQSTSCSAPICTTDPVIDLDDDFRDGSQFSMYIDSPSTIELPIFISDSQEDDEDIIVNPLPKTANPFVKPSSSSSMISKKPPNLPTGTTKKTSSSTTPSSASRSTVKLKRKTPTTSDSNTKKSKSSPTLSPQQSTLLSFLQPVSKPIFMKELVDDDGNIVLSIDD